MLLVPVMVFALSRAFLAVLMWRSGELLASPHIRGNGSVLPRSDLLYGAGSWTRPWFRFDTAWYVGVAQHGYRWGAAGKANTNFLPVYPALIRGAQALSAGSTWLAAWLVANAAFLLALVLLWEWSRSHLGGEARGRLLFFVVAFPFSFFYATPYAEAVFLVLAVAAFLLAERSHWAAATGLAGVCTLTRPVGIAVVLAVAVLALERRRFREAALALLGFVPLAVFALHLGIAFGQPLGFLVSHSTGWVHPHGGLISTLTGQFHTRFSPFDRVDAFLAAVFIAGGVAAWRRFGAAYGVFVLTGVFMPLAHGLVGMERYVIVLFPVFAVWASWKSRPGQLGLFTVSLVGLILATTMYGVGYTLI